MRTALPWRAASFFDDDAKLPVSLLVPEADIAGIDAIFIQRLRRSPGWSAQQLYDRL
jgi:hypothetical protein